MASEEQKPEVVNEPQATNTKREFLVFHSFEEANHYERQSMAQLTSKECMIRLRKFINLAYGMNGYDPSNLPKKRDIHIIDYSK
jgi:hypothetical protein